MSRRPAREPRWRVHRTSGLLVPGFTKLLDLRSGCGTTYLWGIPIGRFRIEQTAAGVELRYLRWPVVDRIEGDPAQRVPIPSAGYIRLPGGRLTRFCTFTLEPPIAAE